MDRPSASTAIPLSLPVQRDEMPVWQSGGVGVFAALALVMLVLVLVIWFLRRQPPGSGGSWRKLMAPRPAEGLRVSESARLTARSSLHVVQWNGRQWLLGCTEQGITVIGHQLEPSASSPVASGDDAGRPNP